MEVRKNENEDRRDTLIVDRRNSITKDLKWKIDIKSTWRVIRK